MEKIRNAKPNAGLLSSVSLLGGAMVISLAMAGGASAGQLTYQPVNPNFGGNSLNGDFLLGGAQVTNQHQDPNPPENNAPEINLPPINIDVDTGGAGGGTGGGQPPIIILPVGGGI